MSEAAGRVYSFEFFPPKTPEGMQRLRGTVQQLAQLHPAFFSVTYGAGGSTREGTLATVLQIREDGQGLEPQLIGTSRHTDALPFATLSDMIVFPPELVTAPVGRNSVEWLRGLSRDILDRVPAPAG